MSDSNIYIDKVMYTDKANVDNKEDAKYIIREIQSVHDYMRAIMSILSNYFISSRHDLSINKYEDLFALDDSVLKEILKEGIFFRGQGMNYDHIIPGIYREMNWYINEKELQKRTEMMAPDALAKAHNNFERLALMQHYGLRTRILDITTNALVALYFAVTDNKDKDGIVYIFRNKKECLTAYDDKVAIKMVISCLNYEQKMELSTMLSKYKNKHTELYEIAKAENEERFSKIVDAVYSFFRHDTGDYYRKIYADELFGIDLVLPNRLDARLLNQEGAFFLFGLEDLITADNDAVNLVNNDEELKDLRVQLIVCESALEEATTADDNDENYDRKKELLKEINTITKQISDKTERIKHNSIIQSLREEANSLIISSEIMYAPEQELDYYDVEGKRIQQGPARIRILQKHKRQLFSELKMLGINEGIIYPDLSHKTSAVNEWYEKSTAKS